MNNLINNNLLVLIAVGIAGIAFLVAIIVMICLIVKVKNLKTEYDLFMRDADGNDISATLKACINQIDVLTQENKEQEVSINELFERLAPCMQKIGLVRFNAFDNVGSNQSYALAALDENNNGFVLSGIYARESSTSYMKPIVGGKSKYPTSDEEDKAVYKAISNFDKKQMAMLENSKDVE